MGGMKTTKTDRLMRVGQAAFRLQVSPRWLEEEAAAGRIPALNCGGAFMVDVDAVKAALTERAAQNIHSQEIKCTVQ